MNEAQDPRVASATVVNGPAGFEPGDTLVRIEQVQINGFTVMVPAAIPGVPEYIATAQAEAEADNLRSLMRVDLDLRGAVPYQANSETYFGFYAAAGSAVTGAVAGLEGFANHHISRHAGPDDLAEYRGQPYTRRELWNKTLDERLGDVLPSLTDTPSPKQEPWWPAFRRVQGMAALSRHGIVEPVARKGLVGEKSLAQRYCDRDYAGAAALMLEVFDYFTPMWLDSERRAKLPRPPNP